MSAPPDAAAAPPPAACARCRLWARLDPVAGSCKAAPPRLPAEPVPGHAGRFGVWPLTVQTDWCGGFQPKESR